MLPPEANAQEILTWDDVDKLIDHLTPQFEGEFDGIVMIARGGLIPGGILSEIMGIKNVHTAAVHIEEVLNQKLTWPTFMQFPIDTLIARRRLLVVDNIWSRGRTMVIVKSRLEAAGATVHTAALHFRPKSNQFSDTGPDYYGAITTNYVVYPWEMPYRFPKNYGSSYSSS